MDEFPDECPDVLLRTRLFAYPVETHSEHRQQQIGINKKDMRIFG